MKDISKLESTDVQTLVSDLPGALSELYDRIWTKTEADPLLKKIGLIVTLYG